MKLIDKDTLIAEIERMVSNGKAKYQLSIQLTDHDSYIAWSEHIATCGKILSFLDTLEVKEVDLDEISRRYALNNTPWDDCVDEIQEAYKAGFELGLSMSQPHITIPDIDDILKEKCIDPNSKIAKMFKESYYKALDNEYYKKENKL